MLNDCKFRKGAGDGCWCQKWGEGNILCPFGRISSTLQPVLRSQPYFSPACAESLPLQSLNPGSAPVLGEETAVHQLGEVTTPVLASPKRGCHGTLRLGRGEDLPGSSRAKGTG